MKDKTKKIENYGDYDIYTGYKDYLNEDQLFQLSRGVRPPSRNIN